MMGFLIGPALYFSILVFCGGLIWRAARYVRGLDWKLDRVAYVPQWPRGLSGALKSIGIWLLPWATLGWRTNPFTTAFFFLFHIGAVLLPLFLLAHAVMFERLFGIFLPSLPHLLADTLTIVSILALACMALRRLLLPYARALTTGEDWLAIILVALPLITGAMTHFGWGDYDLWLILHIISGEAFLIVAPFTKLAHIILFFMSRAQIGMDFGIKRGGANRGISVPW